MRIRVIAGAYGVYRFSEMPLLPQNGFVALTRTDWEISLVCAVDAVQGYEQAQQPFALLGIEGALDFSLIGILAGISEVMAQTGISILAVSTYDTDYFLVPQERLPDAVRALRRKGYEVE